MSSWAPRPLVLQAAAGREVGAWFGELGPHASHSCSLLLLGQASLQRLPLLLEASCWTLFLVWCGQHLCVPPGATLVEVTAQSSQCSGTFLCSPLHDLPLCWFFFSLYRNSFRRKDLFWPWFQGLSGHHSREGVVAEQVSLWRQGYEAQILMP